MKKSLLIFAALSMASGAAMASKARMTALGQSTDGSLYMMDGRNMFFNPASIMMMGDMVTLETGVNGTSTTSTTPGAVEGGFVRSMDAMKYGLQLNHASTANTMITHANSAVGGVNTFAQPNNSFELQVGGDAGLKWGASLIYGNADIKTAQQKASQTGLRLGVGTDMYEAYLGLGLGATADGTASGGASVDTTAKFTGSSSIKLGGNYNLGDGMKVYLDYASSGYKVEASSAQTNKYDATVTTLGFANVMDMDAGNRFFYSVAYEMTSTKTGTTSGATETKYDASALPLTVGIEADAASWLVLRGSVKQSMLLDSQKTDTGAGTAETDSHKYNNTTVAAGMGVKFNKFVVDGVLGVTNTGTINSSNLATSASLTYMF